MHRAEREHKPSLLAIKPMRARQTRPFFQAWLDLLLTLPKIWAPRFWPSPRLFDPFPQVPAWHTHIPPPPPP